MKKMPCRWMIVICVFFLLLSGCREEGDKTEPSAETILTSDSQGSYEVKTLISANPTELTEGYQYGGWNLAMGATRTYVLQKHLYLEDYRKAWDELITIDEGGTAQRQRLSLPFCPDSNNQIVRMGAVFGSDHLVCANAEEGENGTFWRLFELDENLNPVWDFVADFGVAGEDAFPESILRDQDGIVQADVRIFKGAEGVLEHIAFSVSGETLNRYVMEEGGEGNSCVNEWTFAADGTLLLKKTVSDGTLAREDAFSGYSGPGTGILVAGRECDAISLGCAQWVPSGADARKRGSEAVLYVDETGVYRCDAGFTERTLLYSWEEQGYSVQAVFGLKEKQGGEIGVFLREAEDGDCLVLLAPAEQKRESKKIILAVPGYREKWYRSIVNAFNKKNPAWRVEIKMDYDWMRLSTELGAGDGPVLVDTRYVDFESHKKLWEPLDDMLSDAGLDRELLECVMEACKIDGVTYGVPLDFILESAITRDGISAEDWDYEGFLGCLEDPGLQAVYPTPENVPVLIPLITNYLMRNLEDNCLLNVDTPGDCVKVEVLERALDAADRLCADDFRGRNQNDWIEAFQKGEVLCKTVALSDVTALFYVRLEYGKNVSFVGFPTKEGGRSIATAIFPIAIRATATEEEKEIAKAFLQEMLSYERQMAESETNNYFQNSVRKDVFEESIQHGMEEFTKQAAREGISVPRSELERGAEVYRELVNNAVGVKWLPDELIDIVYEEFEEYANHAITREQLIERLRSRIGLYLSENRK